MAIILTDQSHEEHLDWLYSGTFCSNFIECYFCHCPKLYFINPITLEKIPAKRETNYNLCSKCNKQVING